MTLLLLRNNCILLYQSLNFIWSPSNHPGSSTMFFSISACTFLLLVVGASASAVNISMSILSWSLEASSVICKDPSHSNNALILFILLKLILVPLCNFYYMCFVQQILLPSFIYGFFSSIPFLQGKLIDALPNVTTLS